MSTQVAEYIPNTQLEGIMNVIKGLKAGGHYEYVHYGYISEDTSNALKEKGYGVLGRPLIYDNTVQMMVYITWNE